MTGLIYTYALIKALYDRGEDYVDCFWPFAIRVLPADGFVDLGYIQARLKDQFNLDVLLHVLRTILNRAKKKGYVKQRAGKYELAMKGCKWLEALETEREVDSRVNALVDDVVRFFNERNVCLDSGQVLDLLLSFLRRNIEPLVVCINPSAASSGLFIPGPDENEGLLIEYVKLAEQKRPVNYETLQHMILGSIISVVLCAKTSSEIIEIRARKFKHCQVFMDTNFILYLLGLHTTEFNESAKELFDLLKKYEFDLKVFSFTVDEICRVINGYTRDAHRYPVSISVDTLYSSLRRKGWTTTDAREFIANIESLLQGEGVSIEWVDVDLDNYALPDERLRSLMRKYKPYQGSFYQNHDLAVVGKIRELRARPVRRIEDLSVFFLSSDVRLSRFDFIEMRHRENGTVCEVILDRLLANILWLKDPSVEPPLRSIISAHSRDLFIKREIWDRFYEVLRRLRGSGRVSDEAISTLFFSRYIEDALREFDEQDADEITSEFVLERIEEAARHREVVEREKAEEAERKIHEKEEEFLERLKETVSEREREKDKEWLEKIQGIKNSLRESAGKEANRDSIICASGLTLLVLGATYGIYMVCERVGLLEFWKAMIPWLLGSGGGLVGLWTKLRGSLKNKVAIHRYNRKLKQARLEEVVS